MIIAVVEGETWCLDALRVPDVRYQLPRSRHRCSRSAAPRHVPAVRRPPACTKTDADLFVADPNEPILDGALEVYGQVENIHIRHILEGIAKHYGFSLKTPWKDLPAEARHVVLWGSGEQSIEFSYQTKAGRQYQYSKPFEGLIPTSRRRFEETKSQAQKEFYRKFCTMTSCPACEGTRLRPESRSVTIAGRRIVDITGMNVVSCLEFFDNLDLGKTGASWRRSLREVSAAGVHGRVGVGDLTLDRAAPSLGGEALHPAGDDGFGLPGVLYVMSPASACIARPRPTALTLVALDLGTR